MNIYVHIHINIFLCVCTYTHTHHTLTLSVSISSSLPPCSHRYLTTSRCPCRHAVKRQDSPSCTQTSLSATPAANHVYRKPMASTCVDEYTCTYTLCYKLCGGKTHPPVYSTLYTRHNQQLHHPRDAKYQIVSNIGTYNLTRHLSRTFNVQHKYRTNYR